MILNRENNARNEFRKLKSVEMDVLHLYIRQKAKKLDFASRPRAAIFDLAIYSIHGKVVGKQLHDVLCLGNH